MHRKLKNLIFKSRSKAGLRIITLKLISVHGGAICFHRAWLLATSGKHLEIFSVRELNWGDLVIF